MVLFQIVAVVPSALARILSSKNVTEVWGHYLPAVCGYSERKLVPELHMFQSTFTLKGLHWLKSALGFYERHDKNTNLSLLSHKVPQDLCYSKWTGLIECAFDSILYETHLNGNACGDKP